jgi:hypothetical protein
LKISVIGTLVKDYLLPYSGGEIKSLGGIYFTILHLSAILPETYKIIPITYVGNDIYRDFREFIKLQKNISSEGLIKYNRRSNSVQLKYISREERVEFSKNPSPPIPFKYIKAHLTCDFLIINMISGWDINYATLQKIRNNFSGKIYLDIHSYLLGRKRSGERYYRKPDDFQKWFNLVDYIQFNAKEFNVLNSDNLSLGDFFKKYCISKEKLINLTLGENGSKSVYWDKDEVKTVVKKADKTINVCDPTGCGDAFMSGFIFGILSNRGMDRSLELANQVAGINCEYFGAPEMNSLKFKVRKYFI